MGPRDPGGPVVAHVHRDVPTWWAGTPVREHVVVLGRGQAGRANFFHSDFPFSLFSDRTRGRSSIPDLASRVACLGRFRSDLRHYGGGDCSFVAGTAASVIAADELARMAFDDFHRAQPLRRSQGSSR